MIIYKHDPSTTLSDYFAVIISTTLHLEFVDLMVFTVYFLGTWIFLSQNMQLKCKVL